MKFTRIFILRAINIRDDIRNNQNPLIVLKEIIISHPNIDLMLTLILSLLVIFTKYNDDYAYIYSYGINIYLVTNINILALFYHFCLEYFDKLTNTNYQKTNLINNNSEENDNRINNEDNSNFNVQLQLNKLKFSIISLLNLGKKENHKIPSFLYNNYHLYKSYLHFIKILVSCLTYFLSLSFCFIFTSQKAKMDRERYFLLHLLILDFYEFYSGFRVCYFLMKILINLFLIPVYISSIILGFIEDKFNVKLNKIINTKYYTGRSSLRSPKKRISEMEEYCSICLNPFQLDEMVSTLPCSRRHTFHTLCLEKWFITTVTCPLCRSDFQNSIDLHIHGDNIRERPFELQQNLL